MVSLSRAASSELAASSSRRLLLPSPTAVQPVGPRLPLRFPKIHPAPTHRAVRPCSHQPHHSSTTTRPEVRSNALSTASCDETNDHADRYDMNFWSYQPWWWQPHVIVLAGFAIIAASSAHAEDHLRAALYTSIPVAAWTYVFLRVVPCQFRRHAVEYLDTHDLDDL